MIAVHVGAGNIGRGFVGFLLNRAGYELVFVDVNAALIDALNASSSYTVHEVGVNSADHVVSGYRALNSSTELDAVVAEVAAAQVFTTAVGPSILRFVAPTLLAGLRARPAGSAPLVVLACENAIGATEQLAGHVRDLVEPAEWAELRSRVVFANTAVDRIVPDQEPDAGLNVTVETYFEWVIDRTPFAGNPPEIEGVTWVDALEPYIERKLFTVNTGHATTAYFGFAAGCAGIAESLTHPEVRERVTAVLRETKAALVAKHGIDPDQQEAYLQKILHRFANPHLTDTVERVGRQPLRKASRTERFIGPAEILAAHGLPANHLVSALGALFRFDVASDAESVSMRELQRTLTPQEFVQQVTGLDASHPLFADIVAQVPGV